MSFADERDETPDDETAPRRIKWNTAPFELDERTKAKVHAETMAAFCRSIPPEDWVLLQQLSERTRVGLLKQCLQALFRQRGKSPSMAPMTTIKRGADPRPLSTVTLHDHTKEGIWDFLSCGHQLRCKDSRHPYPSEPQGDHPQQRRCDVCLERAQRGMP